MTQTLESWDVDIVCLAGFMRILGEDFVNHWAGRMINIHPSLLPLYKGLHTHERALADGATTHGCTVHFVTPGLDEGEPILQAEVPVLPGDTSDTLFWSRSIASTPRPCGCWPRESSRADYCGSAAMNEVTTAAELAEARPMKVPISFAPSPPPARSDRERKAMNGTPLA